MSVIKTDMAQKMAHLRETYRHTLEFVPEAKRGALTAAAEAVFEILEEEIDARLNDSHGKVKGWQAIHVGSKGGYAAIRPQKEEVRNQYGKYYGYNSAQVTSYLERGHAIPRSYKARLHGEDDETPLIFGNNGRVIVPGRMFYSYARMNAMKAALQAMDRTLDGLTAKFEDEIEQMLIECGRIEEAY